MRSARVFVVVLAGLLLGPGHVAAVQSTDLAGIYLCDGTNPGTPPYTAAVEIQAHGQVWALRWLFPDGDEGRGFGILEGEVLSVIFQTNGGIGWAAYRVQRGGPALMLIGHWGVPGGPGVLATETLTKTTARTLEELKGRQGV